jgi:hypothetical protein
MLRSQKTVMVSRRNLTCRVAALAAAAAVAWDTPPPPAQAQGDIVLTAAESSSKTNGLKMDIGSVGMGWFARADQACRRARRRKGSAFRRASERHALGVGRP